MFPGTTAEAPPLEPNSPATASSPGLVTEQPVGFARVSTSVETNFQLDHSHLDFPALIVLSLL
jgi:hypothetical protein